MVIFHLNLRYPNAFLLYAYFLDGGLCGLTVERSLANLKVPGWNLGPVHFQVTALSMLFTRVPLSQSSII